MNAAIDDEHARRTKAYSAKSEDEALKAVADHRFATLHAAQCSTEPDAGFRTQNSIVTHAGPQSASVGDTNFLQMTDTVAL